ncbi:hypothetical protein GRI40_04045 [Altererythrobacter aerius]|uniref:Uncharacterized protein n=1 Tax=Tsuneonella aeria TaxID=1837929 RepID=A0A6I4TCS1_9SPHN|nr:hypothetical protein [Tsuneonella aeria]MXO74396.1 hypothetical protein [Tsuneonella aeria]
MRRSLVLTDESARHPFRAGLPPHVRKSPPVPDPVSWAITRDDVRGFASAYFASLAAVAVLIV